MNKYTEDGNHIIDASGKLWAVETPHPLPLPEGIDVGFDRNRLAQVVMGPCSFAEWVARPYNVKTISHWLARRPLPPVPKPKTQEELDKEAAEAYATDNGLSVNLVYPEKFYAFLAGIAYARITPPVK